MAETATAARTSTMRRVFAWINSPPGGALILLLLISLAGALLRLYYARQKGMWLDEVHTHTVANAPRSFVGMLKAWWSSSHMQDPPLFYVLSWLNVHGPDSLGHLRLRLVPIAFGTAAIPMFFVLIRRFFSRPVALCAALLMAVNTFAVEYSQEYRVYSMFLFMSILFYDALVLICSQFSWKRFWYFFVASLLLIYTHYFSGVILVAGYLVWGALLLVRQRDVPLQKRIAAIIGLPLLLTFLYLPILIHLPKTMVVHGGHEATVMEMYRNATLSVVMPFDLLRAMSSWRMGTPHPVAFGFVLLVAALGAVAFAVEYPRKAAVVATFCLIALPPSFYFYHWAKFPWDPRRSIWALPIFLGLLSAGVSSIPFLAARLHPGRSQRLIVFSISAILLAGLLAINLANWWRYSARGYRNEIGQADWQGMARFASRVTQPGESVTVPVVNGRTWANSQIAFYARQIKAKFRMRNYGSVAEIVKVLASGNGMWFVMTEPWELPKDLFAFVLQNGAWTSFFGGAVLYLPPLSDDLSTASRQQYFVLREKQEAALAFTEPVASGDVMLSGPLEKKATQLQGTRKRYAMFDLPAGLYRADIKYTSAQGAGTTLGIFRKMKSGAWRQAMDFDSISPASSLVDIKLADGRPTLFMQHDGDVVYRFFLEDGGEYDLSIEAKNDKPGPIGIRVFAKGLPELPEFTFDKRNNKFSVETRRVALRWGVNEIKFYYHTFDRTEEKHHDARDDTNALEMIRWKLERAK